MKKVVMLLSLLVLTLLLVGCFGKDNTKNGGTTNSSVAVASPPSSPLSTTPSTIVIQDKSYIRNAQGVPVVLRLVVVLPQPVEYSCKAAYGDDLAGEEKNGKQETLLFLPPLQGRMDLGKWGVCCQQGSLGNSLQRTTEMLCTV